MLLEPRRRVDVVVVLESMWDWEARTSSAGYTEAPDFFYINPDNFSGRRLHYLLQGKSFIVTNACRELVPSPNHHGTPNPEWLADNLQKVNYNGLPVCGVVAWRTYLACSYRPQCRVVRMKHPAARTWTAGDLLRWKQSLARIFQ